MAERGAATAGAGAGAHVRRRRAAAGPEPEDATAETRRMYGDRVLATGGKGSGSSGMFAIPPPESERGFFAMFASPTAALAELRVIKAQYAALRKLGYAIQAMPPEQLSAEWDTLRATGNEQYEQLEGTIQRFLRHSNMAPRWRPRFYTYYVLPILLNLVKLAVFLSPAGILGVLLYDSLVIGAFTVLRHPWAVSVAVSYAGDHAAIPSMAKTACLYLLYVACKSAVLSPDSGLGLEALRSAVETWDAYRLDLRPLYTAALWLYLAYTVLHQAYTLHIERSWKHRRALDVFLSVASHQVNNLSFVVATYHCYEKESIPYLIYVAKQCYTFIHAGKATQVIPAASSSRVLPECFTRPTALTKNQLTVAAAQLLYKPSGPALQRPLPVRAQVSPRRPSNDPLGGAGGWHDGVLVGAHSVPTGRAHRREQAADAARPHPWHAAGGIRAW